MYCARPSAKGRRRFGVATVNCSSCSRFSEAGRRLTCPALSPVSQHRNSSISFGQADDRPDGCYYKRRLTSACSRRARSALLLRRWGARAADASTLDGATGSKHELSTEGLHLVSHDSDEHKAWVLRFATDLHTAGIDAILDQWDLAPGQDIVAFMTDGITRSLRVILVCTDMYVDKAEAGSGGVGYERLIVTRELVDKIDTKKFLPVVRANPTARKIPAFLGPRLYVDMSSDSDYSATLEQIVREIHGAPSIVKPPLGKNPFGGSVPMATSPARVVGPSGLTPSGQALLDDDWFTKNSATGAKGLRDLKLNGSMELRFALHDPIAKSQIELLNAVRRSEIKTFGWPIGVLLENREEFKPRPIADGIVAEVAITQGLMSDRPSYDLWSLRSSGDFYLLQSLFEDQRSESKLFFDSRVVRVTESLMFCANLYENLGVAPTAPLRDCHEITD